VLGLLLLRPEEALHGREIARRTVLPAATVTRELTRLAEVGVLKRERRGNQMLYGADTACPVYAELASILRKTSGVVDVLIQALTPALPPIARSLRLRVCGVRTRNGGENGGE
jgi:DNA-binding transcriptional ArsR family regulator